MSQMPPDAGSPGAEPPSEPREPTVPQSRKKRELWEHIIAYVLTNLVLVLIWLVVMGGVFWPILPIVGWGIGLGLHIWEVCSPRRGDPGAGIDNATPAKPTG